MGEYFSGLLTLIVAAFAIFAFVFGAFILITITFKAFCVNFFLGMLLVLIDLIAVYTAFYIFSEED